ncbi:probable imidazolonepropionase [Nilaparvata lugens]|uniref:probable imidazolonepropionase n=1 Tax=Nilaparvata lugens TaxID=108931 RepID=UPI00193D3EFA|nr:probable imidazolonepropionase [Nilaparvata lugens]
MSKKSSGKKSSVDDDLSFSDESCSEYPMQVSPMCSGDESLTPPKRLMLMVHSAQQVVTPSFDPLTPFLSGKRQKHIRIFEDPAGGGVGIAVNHEGLIVYIGRTDKMRLIYREYVVDKHIDATGMSVLPGFVDAHTHPVWAGDRIDEFSMKLQGFSYMDIHEQGGGIFSTVRATNEAKTSYLYNTLCKRLKRMAASGTTMVECKSGYGLELDKELRLLEILDQAKSSEQDRINMSITYCGAHAIPENSNAEDTTKRIVDVDLPYIANMNEAGKLRVENVDVFCDQGVFSEENSELILWKAKSLGFQLNFHGDELYPMNSGQMGARVGAKAISHLEKITEDDIKAMKKGNIFAVILPSTAYSMRLDPPPVRALIDAGVPVALGSDFNPNVFCYSMPLIMNLACVYMRMTMEEALVAATLNSAASLGKSEKHGSIVHNKFADLVIINSPRWENIIYDFGNHGQIIKFVVKGGSIIRAPKSFNGSMPIIRTDDVLNSPKRSKSVKLSDSEDNKRMERKRRHSTSSSSTSNKATSAKVSHTQQLVQPKTVVGWYQEQIQKMKIQCKQELQAMSQFYEEALNTKTGLFQALIQACDNEDEASKKVCDGLIYRLVQMAKTSVQQTDEPQAGPSHPQVCPSHSQAGPSQPQAGPSHSQAGPSQPQAGPSHSQAGPSHSQAGPSQPQAGPSHSQAGPSQPQAGPSHSQASPSQPQAGPSDTSYQTQAGLRQAKY